MKKVLTVVGARPQFVKAAMVSRAFAQVSDVSEVIVHTGQHYDANMSQVFFDEMSIPAPKYNLGLGGGTHGFMTGRLLIELEQILLAERPDCVLVYGDTNSTLAAALAAVKCCIPVAHVEAGLRNFDFSIPEDVNRVLTDRVSSALYCSTAVAVKNLKEEGFDRFPCEIVETGDLMADAFFHYSRHPRASTDRRGPYVLCTIHRDFNTRVEALGEIIRGLNEIARGLPVVFPVHPRTRSAILETGEHVAENIEMVDPVGYFEMLGLLRACSFVLTDSGGLQREAYLARKPSLLLLSYTPWEELVESGCSRLCDPISGSIAEGAVSMASLRPDYDGSFYGNGRAAFDIVHHLSSFIERGSAPRGRPSAATSTLER